MMAASGAAGPSFFLSYQKARAKGYLVQSALVFTTPVHIHERLESQAKLYAMGHYWDEVPKKEVEWIRNQQV